MISPPASEAELLDRASQLAGRSLAETAKNLGLALPDLTRHKGFVGQLIEAALGASAGSRPVPDFERLGVELKTVPVDARGEPTESMFVCTVPLQSLAAAEWQASRTAKKLSRVLIVPVEADKSIAPADRRFGSAVLWRPSPSQRAQLQTDWEGFAQLIAAGFPESIDARRGEVLQMRPKGARATEHTFATDAFGEPSEIQRKGFYLRRAFVREILAESYFSASSDRG